jgi:DNA polymerase-1
VKRVIFDIETDGLLPDLTKIHSLVLRDLDTNEVMSCANEPQHTGAPIQDGLEVLAAADVVYGHNSIGFDLPAIVKLHPNFKLRGVHKDTFIIAGMRWAHIKDEDFKLVKAGKFPSQFAGRHSLEAWGHRLGKYKGEYKLWCKENGITEPFAVWRPEMQTYCEGDTDVTRDLVLRIRQEGVSAESVETELELREYLIKMETNGWPFDLDKAVALQGKLAARRQELDEALRKEFGSWEVKDGKPFVPKRDDKKRGYVKDVPVQKMKMVEFNPASRAHIADRLTTLYGWKPEEFTGNSGQPKVDESTLNGLDYPPVALLKEYLLVEKRLGQLAEGKEAWLRHCRLDPRTGLQHIHGRVMQNATITHRAAHSKPNLGQVPKVGSPYGAECRELFMVPPEGWVMVGADASGLEARCLGHFVARFDGGAYAKLLLEGDVHTANQAAFGLPKGKEAVDKDGKKYRDRAKTGYYAWLFGAGPDKMGKTCYPEKPSSEWKKIGLILIRRMLDGTPGLKYLIDAVKPKAKSPGYVLGLDGRRVYIRSEHAALNTLIQSAGAVICKRWIVVFNRRLIAEFGPQGWDGKWAALGWCHDEVQLAVRPEYVEQVKTILVESIESLTEHFKFRCPLTGDAKEGANWRQTH